MSKVIPFSPPDITDKEIDAVVNVLKSGWITSGKNVVDFQNALKEYTGAKCVNALSSATAAMEIALRLYGIKEGDEVITTAYSYAATSNVIIHTGAKVVFVDLSSKDKNDFNINVENIEKAINEKTKAIISVDVGGYPVCYDSIKKVLESKKHLFTPSENKYQQELKRPLFLSDAAHSIGAVYNSNRVGVDADFTAFSFHAVKNVTTAEGGCLLYNDIGKIDADDIYKEISKWALHGQDKSAYDKSSGGWQYSIDFAGYKYNLSDIHAALGLAQLERYPDMLAKRREIVDIYNEEFSSLAKCILPQTQSENKTSSYHLYQLRINGCSEEERNKIINLVKEEGIMLNVHYLPIPAHKAYRDLGYKIEDYPNAFNMYQEEISLPLYSLLSLSDARLIAKTILKYL